MSDVNSTSYAWNPRAVQLALPPGAPAIAPVVLHALLDAMWTSDQKTKIASPASKVKDLLGLDTSSWRLAVEALLQARLLERSTGVDGVLSWESPQLIAEHERLIDSEKDARRRQQKHAAKQAEQERRLSMRGRVGGEPPNPEPHLLYLPLAERSPGQFLGWLPTSRFDQSGQALIITDLDLALLQKEHPEKDVPKVLEALFDDLMRRPSWRPSASRMTQLIDRWMNNEAGAPRRGVDLQLICEALEELPDFQSEETYSYGQ